MPTRTPLSRERVLEAAIAVADRDGVAALTMRALADELGVRAMSLYHHVRNKDEILDGIVDAVFAEMEVPRPGGDWRAEITRRCVSAREVLSRHPWAVPLLESRTTPGHAILRHHEAVLGTFREAGFSVELTAHAYALLDAYVYGFAVQESGLPFASGDEPDLPQGILDALTEAYPRLTEMATRHVLRPGYTFAAEFPYGLDLVLDGLAARAAAAPAAGR